MAKAKSIGTNTGGQIVWNPGYKNILDEGADGTGANDCSALLQQLIDDGHSVYFPGGHTFRVEQRITLNARTGLTLFGDGYSSVIDYANSDPLQEFFLATTSTGLEWHGLHLRGHAITGAGVPGDNNQGVRSAIKAQSCVTVAVRRCFFEGWQRDMVGIWGGGSIWVTDNKFWNNDSGGWNVGGNDINIDTSDSDENGTIPREVIISRNQCLSHNDLGINCSTQSVYRAVITDNIVCAQDANGQEIAQPLLNRRHGINLSYYNGSSDDVDNCQHYVCTGNNVDNTAVCGIMVNSFSDQTNGGVRGTVSNNVINRFGQRIQTADPAVTGGIMVLHHRGAVLSGNRLSNCSDENVPAIRYNGKNVSTLGAKGVISGNSIDNVAGVHISLFQSGGDTTVSGNSLYRSGGGTMVETFLRSSDNNYVTFSGNNIKRAGGGTDRVIHLSCTGAAVGSKWVFVGNQITQDGDGTGNRQMLQITSSTNATVVGNQFNGPESPTASSPIGVRINNPPTGRDHSLNISSNSFRNLNIGIETGSPGTGAGPVVAANNTFEGLTGEKLNSACLYAGQVGEHSVQVCNGTPPGVGTFEPGDECVLDTQSGSALTSGTVTRWRCTVGGSPGTWVAVETIP